jgi:arylsulfatase A-like enzyme
VRRYFQRGGIRYTNAFATTPLCCPSRATILTGRFAHNTRVLTNGPRAGFRRRTLFPRLLRNAGYRTAIVGKFFNSWPAGRNPPFFDYWAVAAKDHLDPTMNVNGTVRKVNGYFTDVVGRFGRTVLHRFEANDQKPWFLYVAPIAPHFPFIAADRHRFEPVGRWGGNPAVFERARSDKPPYVRNLHFSLTNGREVRAGQVRMLMSVDEMVGRLFRTLARLGENRRTLAIFLSDNGYVWAEHGIGGDGGTGGEKRVPYTPSVQIPMYLRWPGHVHPGSRDGRITGNVDIAPTVLDAAGVTPDPNGPPLDGRSLLSTAKRNRLLLEFWGDRIPTWASIRTKTLQYVEYYTDGGARTFREYYNLRRDPWQLRNLLHDGRPGNNPNVAALSARLRRDRRCEGTTGSRACP